jgi:hypothetical protein
MAKQSLIDEMLVLLNKYKDKCRCREEDHHGHVITPVCPLCREALSMNKKVKGA